jgi:ADP-ribose pyrophosphatase YjhB (NUDIX family)
MQSHKQEMRGMSNIDPIFFLSIRTRVVIVHDGKMLLLSPNEPGAGWRLPGGGLELDESLADCAEREILEETGLTVRVTNVAFLREWVVPRYCVLPGSDETGYGMEVYLYAHLISDPLPLITEAGRIETPLWIPLEEVPSYPLWPKELKTLAARMAAGESPRGVPSFVSQLEPPEAPAPDVSFA